MKVLGYRDFSNFSYLYHVFNESNPMVDFHILFEDECMPDYNKFIDKSNNGGLKDATWDEIVTNNLPLISKMDADMINKYIKIDYFNVDEVLALINSVVINAYDEWIDLYRENLGCISAEVYIDKALNDFLIKHRIVYNI
jgi:hypothetical protein